MIFHAYSNKLTTICSSCIYRSLGLPKQKELICGFEKQIDIQNSYALYNHHVLANKSQHYNHSFEWISRNLHVVSLETMWVEKINIKGLYDFQANNFVSANICQPRVGIEENTRKKQILTMTSTNTEELSTNKETLLTALCKYAGYVFWIQEIHRGVDKDVI